MASPMAVMPDTAVWRVPVFSDDPVHGPKDALVTIVEFSEFESPFCRAAAKTLETLLARYPDRLRVVWKDNPVAFDVHSRTAALLAWRVYTERGESEFWRAHDLMFDSQPKLDDAALKVVAEKFGLVWTSSKQNAASRQANDKVDQSIELGGDVAVRGIPHFFINGRRLAGAQSLEVFSTRVEDALAQAAELTARGVPKEDIYEELIKGGKQLPEPEHRDVPEPDAMSPFRGTPAAPQAIQLFAELPCRSCERVLRILDEVEAEYRGQARIVFRFLPPAPPLRPAFAEAAQEVFLRGGANAFWLFQERLLDAMLRAGPVDDAGLEALATTVSVDSRRVHEALASGKHKTRLSSDAAAAKAAGIGSGPAIIVSGYLLGPDPSVARVKKVVRESLRARPTSGSAQYP